MPAVPIKPPRTASLSFERALWARGCRVVFGIDEAGRGAWAGPVAAAAVCLPPGLSDDARLVGVNDSKQVTARRRLGLIEAIRTVALACGVGMASHAEIDLLGIVPATCLAMQRALENAQQDAGVQADYLLLDSIRWPGRLVPFEALVRGDQRSLSIAAASIAAKVSRDAYMRALEDAYPGYGFALHKGYGTAAHRAALAAHGPSPVHRMSFAPMRQRSLL
jgi:ribonuclease HII